MAGRHPTAALEVLSVTVTVLAAALVVGALVMPVNTVVRLGRRSSAYPPKPFSGPPCCSAPRRPRVAVAAASGVLLGAVTVLNALDMGFNQYRGRSFNVVLDWSLLGDAESYPEDSSTHRHPSLRWPARIALVLLRSLRAAGAGRGPAERSPRPAPRHRDRGTLIAGVVWITCSSLGVQMAGCRSPPTVRRPR